MIFKGFLEAFLVFFRERMVEGGWKVANHRFAGTGSD